MFDILSYSCSSFSIDFRPSLIFVYLWYSSIVMATPMAIAIIASPAFHNPELNHDIENRFVKEQVNVLAPALDGLWDTPTLLDHLNPDIMKQCLSQPSFAERVLHVVKRVTNGFILRWEVLHIRFGNGYGMASVFGKAIEQTLNALVDVNGNRQYVCKLFPMYLDQTVGEIDDRLTEVCQWIRSNPVGDPMQDPRVTRRSDRWGWNCVHQDMPVTRTFCALWTYVDIHNDAYLDTIIDWAMKPAAKQPPPTKQGTQVPKAKPPPPGIAGPPHSSPSPILSTPTADPPSQMAPPPSSSIDAPSQTASRPASSIDASDVDMARQMPYAQPKLIVKAPPVGVQHPPVKQPPPATVQAPAAMPPVKAPPPYPSTPPASSTIGTVADPSPVVDLDDFIASRAPAANIDDPQPTVITDCAAQDFRLRQTPSSAAEPAVEQGRQPGPWGGDWSGDWCDRNWSYWDNRWWQADRWWEGNQPWQVPRQSPATAFPRASPPGPPKLEAWMRIGEEVSLERAWADDLYTKGVDRGAQQALFCLSQASAVGRSLASGIIGKVIRDSQGHGRERPVQNLSAYVHSCVRQAWNDIHWGNHFPAPEIR